MRQEYDNYRGGWVQYDDDNEEIGFTKDMNAWQNKLNEQNKKKNKTTIDKQFEYNTYIRDFFNKNKDKSLKQAIKGWKYKKSLKWHINMKKKI